MTLIYFTARQIGSPMNWNGENSYKVIKWRTLTAKVSNDCMNVLIQPIDPRGLSAPAPELYILDSNKNAYFNFGVILFERRFASMF